MVQLVRICRVLRYTADVWLVAQQGYSRQRDFMCVSLRAYPELYWLTFTQEFWNWFDHTAWYPLGRVVGGTIYPGLMATSGVIYNILHSLHLPVDIRNICVLLAPGFSALTAWATYM